MEKVNYRIIQTKDFADEALIRLRFACEDPLLESSVRKTGVMNPLLVSNHDSLAVIDGHKRLFLAKKLNLKEIPCLCLETKLSAPELFKIALIWNWNSIHNDLDKAQCLKTARDFAGLSGEDIIRDILPALGLKSEEHVYEAYVKTLSLAPELLDLIVSKKIPFRGSQALLNLKPADQVCFAREVAVMTALTTNDLIKAGEWLHDLLRTSGAPLSLLLDQQELRKILDYPKWDARLKTDKFMERLRQIRQPKLTAMEEKLMAGASGITSGEKDMSIRFPQDLEESGFTLQMKVRDRRSLERLCKTLEEKKNLLNSLFDLML